MITNTKDGKTMFLLLRNEIKDFNINQIKPHDVIVIEHSLTEKRFSDYFISVNTGIVRVTKRCDFKDISEHKQPYYLRDFITDIKLNLRERRKILNG